MIDPVAENRADTAVRRVLSRLAQQGLVTVTPSGQALLYVANRHHLAWAPIEALTRMRHTLLERLGDEIRSWSVAPVTAALFGSTARGDGDTDSDVDLLVVRPGGLDNDEQWLGQLDDLKEHATAWTGNHCQVYELDEGEFSQHVHRGEPIVDEWTRDAVLLAGEPVGRLVDTVRKAGRR